MPGKAHLDKKKQIPLLYSTMIRKLYLKHKMDDNCSVKSSGDVQLVNSVADMKLNKPTNDHGSQKSLFKDKIKNHLSVARVPLTVADVHQAHYVRVAVFT